MSFEGQLSGPLTLKDASAPAFVIDAEQRIVAANEALAELLGKSVEAIVGQACYRVVGATQEDGTPVCGPDCAALRAYREGRGVDIPTCFLRIRAGDVRTVSLTGVAGTYEGRPAALVLLQPKEATGAHLGNELRIYTLGRFAVVINDKTVEIHRWARKQALYILKMLVTHRGAAVHREEILEQLWPGDEFERAWPRLKVAVHYLRKALRDAGLRENVVETSGDAYMLRSDRVWIDADLFERYALEARDLMEAGKESAARLAILKAVSLYRGPFMNEDRYDEVFTDERKRLEALYQATRQRFEQLYGAPPRA